MDASLPAAGRGARTPEKGEVRRPSAGARFAPPRSPEFRHRRGASPPRPERDDHRPDRLANLALSGEDVHRRYSDADVSQTGRPQIPRTISHLLIPALMEFAAVALDDEPALHDEVRSADLLYLDLHLESDTQRSQDQFHEGFGTGLGDAVYECEQGPVSLREPLEDGYEMLSRQQPMMKHAVKRRDRRPRRLAPNGLPHCIVDRYGMRETDVIAGYPMKDCVWGSPIAAPRKVRAHLDVHPCGFEYEDPEQAEEGYAGDPATDVERGLHVFGHISYRVDPVPDPGESTTAYRPGDRVRGQPGLAQVIAAEDLDPVKLAQAVEHSLLLRHSARLPNA